MKKKYENFNPIQIQQPILNAVKLQQPILDAMKVQQPILDAMKLQQPILDTMKVQQPILDAMKVVQQPILDAMKLQQQSISQQTKILKTIITASPKLLPLHEIDTNFIEDNLKKHTQFLYNLWSIDWYIPFWKIPIVINNTYINNTLNNDSLKELDDELFNQLKNEVNNETNFLKNFDNNDIGLFYLYKNKSYKDVVLLSLIKIESILTNFVNYLDNKKIPNLYDYLNGNRNEYKIFCPGKKDDYKSKLETLKSSTTDTFDKNALICLIYLFSDGSTSQLYYNFDRGDENSRCKVTPSGEIPLCRNLFLHGFGYEDDISQKLATKALFAYKFFTEFSINK